VMVFDGIKDPRGILVVRIRDACYYDYGSKKPSSQYKEVCEKAGLQIGRYFYSHFS